MVKPILPIPPVPPQYEKKTVKTPLTSRMKDCNHILYSSVMMRCDRCGTVEGYSDGAMFSERMEERNIFLQHHANCREPGVAKYGDSW